jgi:molybdenum cofactor cytidylyltransferase
MHNISGSGEKKGIWAIVLAAGESRRMGFPKMLLEIRGKPMIENVILNVLSSGIENILVVLGADHERVKEPVKRMPVQFCYNENYRDGMLSSVRCGLQNLPDDFEAVLFFQGDQPFISHELIDKLTGIFQKTGRGIIIPLYDRKRGHPLLVGRKYRNKIEELDDSAGLRSLAQIYADDVLEVETEDNGILIDCDTYDDYMNIVNKNE